MANDLVTFRVYRANVAPGDPAPAAVKIGPDLIVDVASTGTGAPIMLIAVDPNPGMGATYIVTAQSTAADINLLPTSTIMLLSVGS